MYSYTWGSGSRSPRGQTTPHPARGNRGGRRGSPSSRFRIRSECSNPFTPISGRVPRSASIIHGGCQRIKRLKAAAHPSRRASTSPSSGKRFSSFFENTLTPSTLTSKTPPLEGINSSELMLLPYRTRSFSANLAARTSYPQAEQNSIAILRAMVVASFLFDPIIAHLGAGPDEV